MPYKPLAIKLDKMNEAFDVSEFIVNKIMKRVQNKMLGIELDKRKGNYCIDLALASSLKTMQVEFNLKHDPGDIELD